MVFYKPNSLAYWKRSAKITTFRSSFYYYRKYRWRNYWHLAYSLWFIAFLLFSFRFGSTALLTTFSPAYYNASVKLFVHNNLPNIPKASRGEKNPSWQSRIIISIEKNGFTLIEGKQYKEIEALKILKSKHSEDPRKYVLIVADKECKMASIYTVFYILRLANLRKVSFATK